VCSITAGSPQNRPDGKYLVFSRAAARDPYPPGYLRSLYANDRNETQIQY
jgi:hypothetical protein